MDIVESVSPTIPEHMSQNIDEEEEDDEERMKRIKAEIKAKITEVVYVLCIWDCAKIWIWISELCAILVFDPFVDLFITLCIVVNVVFMALDQYDENYADSGGMSPFLASMLVNGNYVFTAIFAVESFIKLAAMSPRYFFADKMNIFDFIIVAFSIVELLAEGIKSLSLLRSFRLLRVFKLAKSWKSLNDILKIMINSLGALSNLTVVLLIIIFIFAVMGMQLFGQNYVDNVCEKFECKMPRWHFIDFFHR